MKGYRLAFFGSLVFHVGIACLLVFSVDFSKTLTFAPLPKPEQPEAIEAVVIDQKALHQEISRLDKIEKNKVAEEKARQEKLAEERRAVEKKRQAEEEKVAQLKKEAARLKNEAVAQEKAKQERAAKLKKEKEALEKIEQEKAKALADKKAAEKQKKEALAAKELAEKKQKEAIAAKEAAEKKRKEALAAKEKAAKEKAAEKKRQEALAVKAAEEKRLAEEQAEARMQKLIQDQISQYASLIQAKIHQNWRQPPGIDFEHFTCKIAVKLLPTGEVVEAVVVESSGNVEFDRSTELAVRKSSPLPLPDNPKAAEEFRRFTFSFVPEAV